MRVAMIPTPELASDWGSTLHAKLLAGRLAEVGVEVHVYCRSVPRVPHPSVRYRELPLPVGHPVLVEECISDPDLATAIAVVAGAVVADHQRRPFDVIHAHYATLTGMAGVNAKVVCGPPLVVSSFGRDLHVGAARDVRYRRMVELCVAQADALIASDAGVARELVDDFAAGNRPIYVVPMGVDERLFSPDASQAGLGDALRGSYDALIVNVSSCFGGEKGLDIVLRAVGRLRDRGRRVRLVVIGADDHEDLRCQRELRGLAAELDLSDAVAFLGRLPHEAIPPYLTAADVVVDPRRVGNFSSVVLEALFSGACVLASDVPGSRPWLAGGGHGALHRTGDVDDLSARLEKLLSAPALRRQMRGATRAWREGEGRAYTADEMSKRILAAYRAAIAAHTEGAQLHDAGEWGRSR